MNKSDQVTGQVENSQNTHKPHGFYASKDSDITLCDIKGINAKPKPKRWTVEDRADGLDILIQKTKAIGLRAGEEGLGPNENGNEWLEALCYKGEKLLWGVTKIRKYVCGGSDNHAKDLIEANVLDRLVFFLDEVTDPPVLFEVLWTVTNIAAGPTAHTTCLVEKGYLMPLGKLLNHPMGNIRTQAAWAIGNVIGDREGYRDRVLEAGLLPLILNIWKGEFPDLDSKKESLRISLWIVDNMCRYKPDWHLMQPAFEIIPMVLNENEPFILKECSWAVARILHQSGRNRFIDQMITPAFCSRLVEILGWQHVQTTHPILRALINLASSKNPLHLKYIVNAGLFDKLNEYLTINPSRHKYETFGVQILGNLCHHQEYAAKLLNYQGLCSWMMRTLENSGNKDLKHEICVCIRNMLLHRDHEIALVLLNLNMLDIVRELLKSSSSSPNAQLTILEILSYLSNANSKGNNGTQVNFKESIKNSLYFKPVLDIHMANIGANDHDFLLESEHEVDSESETEETPAIIPFNITNPNGYLYSQNLVSKKKLKEKTVYYCYSLLMEIYPEEFHLAIKRSQEDSSFAMVLDGLAMGERNKICDLTEVFGRLSPSKSSK